MTNDSLIGLLEECRDYLLNTRPYAGAPPKALPRFTLLEKVMDAIAAMGNASTRKDEEKGVTYQHIDDSGIMESISDQRGEMLNNSEAVNIMQDAYNKAFDAIGYARPILYYQAMEAAYLAIIPYIRNSDSPTESSVVDPKINNAVFDKCIESLGQHDDEMNRWFLDEGNIRHFLAAYVTHALHKTEPVSVSLEEMITAYDKGYCGHKMTEKHANAIKTVLNAAGIVYGD